MTTLPPALFTIALLLVAFLFCGRLINWCVPLIRRRVVAKFQDRTPEDIEPRAKTLGLAVRKGGVIAIRILTGIGLLKVLGVDTAPLSAAIGVFGVALGFGARAMVQDLLAGLWILVEDRFRLGDQVEINGVAGTVVNMTFRVITVKDEGGSLHLFQNGQIRSLMIGRRGV
ncbi:MAG: mechanosensitive ion channel [Acidobacteriota bacterium]|nr:mechanosensitive ion channel [Acidobacteriota bacterium]